MLVSLGSFFIVSVLVSLGSPDFGVLLSVDPLTIGVLGPPTIAVVVSFIFGGVGAVPIFTGEVGAHPAAGTVTVLVISTVFSTVMVTVFSDPQLVDPVWLLGVDLFIY